MAKSLCQSVILNIQVWPLTSDHATAGLGFYLAQQAVRYLYLTVGPLVHDGRRHHVPVYDHGLLGEHAVVRRRGIDHLGVRDVKGAKRCVTTTITRTNRRRVYFRYRSSAATSGSRQRLNRSYLPTRRLARTNV